MISVVMPVYNSEKHLEKAIESILEQTYTDLELIIIDDGSTDSSPKIVKQYAQMDQRVRIISQENSGVSAARNTGIDAARGEWLYFMDSDDYVDLSFLQEMMIYSESYDMLITGVNRHYINGEKQDYTVMPPNLEVSNEIEYGKFLGEVIKDKGQDLIFNYIWNKMIRSSLVIDGNIRFREKISLGEDFLFNCDLLDCSISIKTIRKAYYHYNIYEEISLARRFYTNELERRNLIFQRTIELYSHYSVYHQYREDLEIREGRFSYHSLSKIKNKSCGLIRNEKIKYIDGIMRERKKYVSMYLAREKGVINQIKRMVILTGNARLVYLMLSGFFPFFLTVNREKTGDRMQRYLPE